jgi:predicted TPR repeat methyltransferase
MDHCAITASAFHKHAETYRDKYMDLTMYDDYYRQFCDALRSGPVRVLDAACGPGAVSRYLKARRPELDLLGIDLAPRMVELARETVPSAHFAVHDCRRLAELSGPFDGIICAFGLPYLSMDETTAFIKSASEALVPGGVLYLSTMLGKPEDSGVQRSSTGDQVYVYFHSEEQIISSLHACGFAILTQTKIPSPAAASKKTTDLIVIAKAG